MNRDMIDPIARQNPKDCFVGAGYALVVAFALLIARVATGELGFPQAAIFMKMLGALAIFAASLWAAWGCFVFAWQCVVMLRARRRT